MMVPKLRFTGFNEPWSETSLGKISSFITSGSRDWAQYYSDCGDKFIRMTNLVRDGITLNLSDLKFVRLPENSNEGKRTALQHHDILISITAELGKLGWVPDDLGTAYINQHTALVRPNLSIASSKFIANLLSTKKYNNILNLQNDAGAKSGLNLSTIKNFGFYAPNKIEQARIADFLSSVDEKISLLNKQYDLLCQYKKGMMQKIFSQEVRFKDEYGEEFPEWEESLLSERIKVQGGFAFKSQLFSEMASTKVLRIGDISEEIDLSAFSGVFSTETPAIRYQVNKGDFVMALSGATFGKMGLIKCESAFLNQRVATFRLLDNTTDILSFYYYYMSTMEFINYIKSIPTASAQPNISNKDIELYLSFIPTKKEQTKIANFLSALDNKIAVKKAELDKLKTWKQGLLQQMFV
ncbi:restriction endonuclease subunit S [Enterobacter roggenkampii]|uniref:Restriction endonuclease subunit S n=2 Tax=Enterobacter roggenkampii TaxID=1812935 RepID=A0ABD4R9G9_9ENTR|nr:restriction endonuclease subunit S [Enterobacter roggenkampii]MBU3756781.1 restriction endonuclease subunit S [Enterobacter roggenkampii]MBU3763735.1 restriction endonuclease subunit S [Enterobacter roggenkampii]MBU3768362.1 restriction endonuclease subunit S [Enterobacter roggenkampii]MBU3773228.1 restriction endonuclease subunit S [Enterobacter roggenkampii]